MFHLSHRMFVKLKTHNKWRQIYKIEIISFPLMSDLSRKKNMVRNILIAFCVILLASCSKDTGSKLFGKWQLQKVETSGDVQNVDTVYFNFEHSLFMYQVYVTEIDSFRHQYGYNTLEGEKTLLLELENDPTPISKFLPYTDWDSAKQTYTIEKLESKQLILSREGKTYTFRKF